VKIKPYENVNSNSEGTDGTEWQDTMVRQSVMSPTHTVAARDFL